MPYFKRLSETSYLATASTGGAWNTAEQHIAPALGLLVHCVDVHKNERKRDDLVISRLSFDILGTVPIGVVETTVAVVRPGRTIELVEAALLRDGRPVVSLRAWLMRSSDTADVAATPLASISPLEHMPKWDPTTLWPGGYIASVDVRRTQIEPGRADYWVRTTQAVIDEPTSPLASIATLFDIANGMTVRASPEEVAFPNLDLTVHLFRQPRTPWLGFRTDVSFGDNGIGLTHSILHDEAGPLGTMSQILTIRRSNGVKQ